MPVATMPACKANKRVQFGYGFNYLVDLEHAVIVDVEATPARTYDEIFSPRNSKGWLAALPVVDEMI